MKIILICGLSYLILISSIGFGVIHYRHNHYTYLVEELTDDGKVINKYYTHFVEVSSGKSGNNSISFRTLESKISISFSGKWRVTEITNNN